MNISAVTKLIAVSSVLALAAILFFPFTSQSSAYAKESEPIVLEFSSEEGVFFVGEELVYNVSYSVFDLGSVKVQVTDTITKMGTKVYRAKAYINSYDGVPFVDLHQVFYSEVTPKPYSIYFTAYNTAKPDEMEYSQYSFDYKNDIVNYERGIKPKNIITQSGEVPIQEFQQDGLSLFFFARLNVKEKKRVKTATFVNENSFTTSFNFLNKVGSQEIDAVKYPIETVEFEGIADFIGIFGMTGYFQGFFSNDEAAVPIVAKMKVLIGSIHIELVKWNRPGWVPPKYKKK